MHKANENRLEIGERIIISPGSPSKRRPMGVNTSSLLLPPLLDQVSSNLDESISTLRPKSPRKSMTVGTNREEKRELALRGTFRLPGKRRMTAIRSEAEDLLAQEKERRERFEAERAERLKRMEYLDNFSQEERNQPLSMRLLKNKAIKPLATRFNHLWQMVYDTMHKPALNKQKKHNLRCSLEEYTNKEFGELEVEMEEKKNLPISDFSQLMSKSTMKNFLAPYLVSNSEEAERLKKLEFLDEIKEELVESEELEAEMNHYRKLLLEFMGIQVNQRSAPCVSEDMPKMLDELRVRALNRYREKERHIPSKYRCRNPHPNTPSKITRTMKCVSASQHLEEKVGMEKVRPIVTVQFRENRQIVSVNPRTLRKCGSMEQLKTQTEEEYKEWKNVTQLSTPIKYRISNSPMKTLGGTKERVNTMKAMKTKNTMKTMKSPRAPIDMNNNKNRGKEVLEEVGALIWGGNASTPITPIRGADEEEMGGMRDIRDMSGCVSEHNDRRPQIVSELYAPSAIRGPLISEGETSLAEALSYSDVESQGRLHLSPHTATDLFNIAMFSPHQNAKTHTNTKTKNSKTETETETKTKNNNSADKVANVNSRGGKVKRCALHHSRNNSACNGVSICSTRGVSALRSGSVNSIRGEGNQRDTQEIDNIIHNCIQTQRKIMLCKRGTHKKQIRISRQFNTIKDKMRAFQGEQNLRIDSKEIKVAVKDFLKYKRFFKNTREGKGRFLDSEGHDVIQIADRVARVHPKFLHLDHKVRTSLYPYYM